MSAQPPRHGVGWVCEGFCPHPEGRGIPEHLRAATFVLLVTPDGQKYVTVPRGMALGKLLGVSLRLLTPPSSPVYQCEPSFTGAPTPGSRVNIANICLSHSVTGGHCSVVGDAAPLRGSSGFHPDTRTRGVCCSRLPPTPIRWSVPSSQGGEDVS